MAIPTPRRLYVHDDLTGEVRAEHGAGSEAAALADRLLALVRRDGRVTVLTLEAQLAAVQGRGGHAPFALAVAIGRAGERVAGRLHARTGWFPAIRRVDVAREEDGRGGYVLVSPGGRPWRDGLSGLNGCPSLAVVDDTVFSGLTARSVLAALPAPVRARAHVFCLRGVAESLATLPCPVTAGLAAPGRLLEDVSFINASGLVRPGAIRVAGAPPLAFHERAEWITAWFPGRAPAVIDLCRRLRALLAAEGVVRSPDG